MGILLPTPLPNPCLSSSLPPKINMAADKAAVPVLTEAAEAGGAEPESPGPETSALTWGAWYTNLGVAQVIYLGVEARHC